MSPLSTNGAKCKAEERPAHPPPTTAMRSRSPADVENDGHRRLLLAVEESRNAKIRQDMAIRGTVYVLDSNMNGAKWIAANYCLPHFDMSLIIVATREKREKCFTRPNFEKIRRSSSNFSKLLSNHSFFSAPFLLPVRLHRSLAPLPSIYRPTTQATIQWLRLMIPRR